MFTKATIEGGEEDVPACLGDLSSLCRDRYSGFHRATLRPNGTGWTAQPRPGPGGIDVQGQMEYSIPTSSTTC